MIQRLVEHLVNTPNIPLSEWVIEDIALCSAWLESYKDDATIQKKWGVIRELVQQWITTITPSTYATEGRRTQWLTRDLIDLLQAGWIESCNWSECFFLKKVHELCQQVQNRDMFARLSSLLSPYWETINIRYEIFPPQPGMTDIENRIYFISTEDIEKAKPRQIRSFAGFPMESVGPVFSRNSHIKILGSVPENCTVVAPEGSCCIEEFMMGKLAVRDHCDVRENISGIAISREGDIRARNIVDHAFVVSKGGSVQCRQAQNPDLVYGHNRIRIEGNAFMGKYVSPHVHIHKEAKGCRIDVSRKASAFRFTHMGSSPCCIVLLPEISVGSYGATVDRRAVILERKGHLLRKKIQTINSLKRQMTKEVNVLSENTIRYICIPEKMQDTIEEIQSIQRRMAIIQRIMRGLDTLATILEQKHEVKKSDTDDQLLSDVDLLSVFSDLDKELKFIIEESGSAASQDLQSQIQEMQQLYDRLSKIETERPHSLSVLSRIHSQIDVYIHEIKRLSKKLEEKQASVDKYVNNIPFLAKNKGKNKFPVLIKILKSAQGKDAPPELRNKSQTAFVRMMMRKIQNRINFANRYQKILDQLEAEFNEVARILKEEFQVIIGEPQKQENLPPRAEGRFEGTVYLLSDPTYADDPNPPEEVCIKASPSNGEVHTYILGLAGSITREGSEENCE